MQIKWILFLLYIILQLHFHLINIIIQYANFLHSPYFYRISYYNKNSKQQIIKLKQLMIPGRFISDPFKSVDYIKNTLISLKNPLFHNYPSIYTFEFLQSPLNRFSIYEELTSQIVKFNQKLELWKENRCSIPNITVIYGVYQNLSSRLKTLNYIKQDKKLQKQLQNLRVWFHQNRLAGLDRGLGNISNLIKIAATQHRIKRRQQQQQVQMYLNKQRTQHPEYRPPRQRLSDFKRKQLQTPKTQQNQVNRISSSNFTKTNNKYTTTGTIDWSGRRQIQQKTQFKSSQIKMLQSQQKNVISVMQNGQNTNNKNDQINNEIIQLQSPLPGDQNQQNQYEVQQEQIDKGPLKKPFTSDFINRQGYSKSQYQYKKQFDLQEKFSFAEHKVLLNQVRALQQKKLDQQSQNKIINWGKYRSKSSQQLTRNVESQRIRNKFKDIEFKVTGNDQMRMVRQYRITREQFIKNEILDNNIAFKIFKGSEIKKDEQMKKQRLSKLLQQQTTNNSANRKGDNNTISTVNRNGVKFFLQKALQIEQEIKKKKMQKTLETYSKYINKHIQNQNQNHSQQMQQYLPQKHSPQKQLSLTHKRFNSTKSTSFGQILFKNHPQLYNEQSRNYVNKMKNILSNKGVGISLNTLSNSLKIPIQNKYVSTDKLPVSGDKLMSNPFFPKHLYVTKPKKKKKKK